MDIQKGIKLKGRPVEIPNCGRNDFAKFLYNTGLRTGVEVGVDRGEYTKVLCDAGLKVYGVDPWVNYDDYKRAGRYESRYEWAEENLRGYDCELIRKFSIDAAKDFKDESIDFVYIDGNHTLPYVVQDIFAWERKVKRGGIISGHDYARIKGHRESPGNVTKWDGCHVKMGVDACADVMKIEKYYILGKRFQGKRDKWRTWFWIKK